MTFNRNCFPKNERRFNVRPPTGSHVHCKTGMGKYGREIDTLLPSVPLPMTLDDLAGYSPNAGLINCNSTNICATSSTVFTDTARRAAPRR